MTKCLECGLIYEGWPCPSCTSRKEHEERIARANEEHESNIEEALESEAESRNEYLQQMADLVEAQAAMAAQSAKQRKKDLSEAWKLEAINKADEAYKLYKTGLYERAIKLCEEAIDQYPHIDAYRVAIWSCLRIKRVKQASEYLKELILLVSAPDCNNADKFAVELLGNVLDIENVNLCELFIERFRKAPFPLDLIAHICTAECQRLSLQGLQKPHISADRSREQFTREIHDYLARIPFTRREQLLALHSALKTKSQISQEVLTIIDVELTNRYAADVLEQNRNQSRNDTNKAAMATMRGLLAAIIGVPIGGLISFVLIIIVSLILMIFTPLTERQINAFLNSDLIYLWLILLGGVVGVIIGYQKGTKSKTLHGFAIPSVVAVATVAVVSISTWDELKERRLPNIPSQNVKQKSPPSGQHEPTTYTEKLAVRKQLIGNWTGTVNQPGFGAFTANMKLNGIDGGTLDYPSIGCGGSLSFTDERNGSFYYTERITYGRNKCSDGRLEIRPSDNAVHYEWSDGTRKASGTLYIYKLDSAHEQQPINKPAQNDSNNISSSKDLLSAKEKEHVRRSEKDKSRADYWCRMRQENGQQDCSDLYPASDKAREDARRAYWK